MNIDTSSLLLLSLHIFYKIINRRKCLRENRTTMCFKRWLTCGSYMWSHEHPDQRALWRHVWKHVPRSPQTLDPRVSLAPHLQSLLVCIKNTNYGFCKNRSIWEESVTKRHVYLESKCTSLLKVMIKRWAGWVEGKGQLNVGPTEMYGELYVSGPQPFMYHGPV